MVISTIFDPMKIKRILYFIISCIIFFGDTHAFAQIKSDSLRLKQNDTSKTSKKNFSTAKDTIRKKYTTDTPGITKKYDTLNKISRPDISKLKAQKDSSGVDDAKIYNETDTWNSFAQPAAKSYRSITNDLLLHNRFINVRDAPFYFIQDARQVTGKEFLFYALCIVVFILGIFKTFYSQYFNNLFRVFFNTSLRQTQLTDQLMQAKLPSFILNIFFTLTAGVYIWLLFTHFHPPRLISSKLLLPFCILSVAILYFVKYCLLKFMGWVSDIQQATDNYIFVIFLINKITGILLVPFIILLAFSIPQWINGVTTISLLVVGLFFISRYIKSYGVVGRKFTINPFHFIIYVIGVEIIPLLIIYKVAVDYLM